jgi:XRE family transcriptional regulator, aerobic/anaerobic benzoate catabolism transcriptional regulator
VNDVSDPEKAFLEQLGQRIRTERALRGMSRKVVANLSGISQRYVAQLESGKGNGSIILLRRVCRALGAHLEDMIPVDPSPDLRVFRELLRKASPDQITQARETLAVGDASARNTSVTRVALIGLRGAGRSTLGRILAGCHNWNFIDLNKEIEREAGLALPDIIAFYGEEGFRRLGEAALQNVLASEEPMVLVTSNGIVSEPATFDLILSSFYTVWLKAKPEEHMARLRRSGDLPPMPEDHSAMADLRSILVTREPLYSRAAAVVDTAGLSIDIAAVRLIETVRTALQNGARPRN